MQDDPVSDIHSNSPSKKIVILDDKPVLSVPLSRVSAISSASLNIPDSDSADSASQIREIDPSRVARSIKSDKDTVILKRRKRSVKVLRQLSISDTDTKRTVKDISKFKKLTKKVNKKYSDIPAKIDTGSRPGPSKSSVDHTDSELAHFTSAYETPAIQDYQVNIAAPGAPPKIAKVVTTIMDTDQITVAPPPLEVNVHVANMDVGQLSSDEESTHGTQPFVVPRKTSRLSSLLSSRTSPPPITTGNQFQTLAHLTTEQEIRTKTRTAPKPPTPVALHPKKIQNPPPLVLAGIPSSHKELLAELRQYIKKPFSLRYTANNSIVYTTDKADYATLKQALQDTINHEFHTYTPRDQKRHAFVLLGLQGEPDLEEIKHSLEDDYEIQVYNIFRMRTKRSPLFLVIVSNEVTLKTLQTTVKTLLYTRVKWERRRNERLLTQCRRCQLWGHATSNCFRSPNCVKCAGSHFSRECSITPEQSVKCYNCRGPHVASSVDCPIYAAKLAALQTQDQQVEQPKKFVEAPLPTVNPWKKTPSLPAAAAPAQRVQRQPAQPSQPQDQSSSHTDFSRLMQELTTLNTLIDLKQTIAAIATLNKMLVGAKEPLQVILVMQDFVSVELPKFNIMRSA